MPIRPFAPARRHRPPGRRVGAPVAFASLGWLAAAHAAPAAAEPPGPVLHAVELGAGASQVDAFGRLRWRARLPRGVQLGLATRHGFAWEHVVVGYAVDEAYLGETRAELVVPVYDDGELWLGVELAPGLRLHLGPEDPRQEDLDTSWAFVVDAALLANVRLDERWTVRTGVRLPFSLEVSPEVVNDVTGTLLVAGATVAVSDRAQLFAELETGGLFGAEGDGLKFLVRGAVGARLLFGPGAPARAWTTF